jgi:hypothetical protein
LPAKDIAMDFYSICFLDRQGLAKRSEFGAFESDAAASVYARSETPLNEGVEVWRENQLVTRLFRNAAGLVGEAVAAAAPL